MRRLTAAALILALAGPAWAHPHSYLDASLGLVLADGRVAAVEVTWLFDELDTEIALDGNDKNGDGKLDAAELDDLATRMQKHIATQQFHTHLRVDGKVVPITGIDRLRLTMQDKRMRARFRATLAEPVDPRARKVTIGLYDDSYYIQFGFDPARDLKLDGALPQGCRVVTYADRTVTIFEVVGSKVHPTVTGIECDK
ncbi:DUF1007 family protein [Desertibaculum subflavum]|uniref:DUF1007 family protein n=1 Tax=Desertibaculum subflavum TaxID=2268458 RepID=UPI0013C44A1C